MPASVKPDPISLPLDPAKPFGPFPYDLAKQLFFTTLSDKEAQHYHTLLVPESPQAVLEATHWTVDINLEEIDTPTIVFATELDKLTPADSEERLARMMGADYVLMPGIGHTDLLLKDPEWQQAAQRIKAWLP